MSNVWINRLKNEISKPFGMILIWKIVPTFSPFLPFVKTYPSNFEWTEKQYCLSLLDILESCSELVLK